MSGDAGSAAGAAGPPGGAGADDEDDAGSVTPGGEAAGGEASGTGEEERGTGDVEELDPLARAVAERDEYLDSLRRLQAEFENYRKRVASQQADQQARAVAGLVDKLLPVLDALDLGAQHLGDAESAEAKALVAAGSLLQGVLAKEGLERVDPTGEPFDPTAHEAVSHVPAEEEADPVPDTGPVVVAVMRPGYRWKGTVIRPAMVTVRG